MAVILYDIPKSMIVTEEYKKVTDGVLFNPRSDKLSERELVIMRNLKNLKKNFQDNCYRIVVINGFTRSDPVIYYVTKMQSKEEIEKSKSESKRARMERFRYL